MEGTNTRRKVEGWSRKVEDGVGDAPLQGSPKPEGLGRNNPLRVSVERSTLKTGVLGAKVEGPLSPLLVERLPSKRPDFGVKVGNGH